MPKFKILFSRRVVEFDCVEREVEATDEAAAWEAASAMADEFNDDCPGDARVIGAPECEEWTADEIEEAS